MGRTVPTIFFIGLATTAGLHASTIGYSQTNLTSDIPGRAANTDPNLVNPWGISFGPTTPFWISDNAKGVSTLYNGAGMPRSLVVTIPPPSGGTPPAAPTGTVFNSTSANFMGDRFLFATEDGTITGWQGGASASLRVDNSASGAIYKSLAISNDRLYAADFHGGTVDVFDSNYKQVSVAGGFTDPNLPAGYAPFNIQNINGSLYVTYALQDAAKTDDVAGPGNGFVDVFDSDGNLMRRLVSNGALNSPWGLELAPAGFGMFGGDLLVGNFGDGMVNAYDLTNGALVGTLTTAGGAPLSNDGLWALAFGNGSNGFDRGTLYFTAGLDDESHGLFGSIAPVPEPTTWSLVAAGVLALALTLRRPRGCGN